MGAAGILAKWIGKTLGEAVRVPVENGIMFPIKIEYAVKIKDLAKETNRVSPDYLKSLVEEAHQKNDIAGLKTIYKYLLSQEKIRNDNMKSIKYMLDHHVSTSRRDTAYLHNLYDQLKATGYGDSLLNSVIRYGREIKLHESVGDPFALLDHIEKVVTALC